MKMATITEVVTFRVPEAVTDEQVISRAEALLDFQHKIDGFIDAQLLKDTGESAWCFIYHFENMEKVEAMRRKLTGSKPLEDLISLTAAGSLQVVFYREVKSW